VSLFSIAENLEKVRAEIADAAKKAGRKAQDISLLAVSKTKPIELIREAFGAGQKLFGENYVQEAKEKIDAFPGANWHLIGPLQSNKVKLIVGKVDLIHTIDREKLANEIEKVALSLGLIQDVLIQIHVGDEATKSGVSISDVPELIETVASLPHLRLRGLMALPPLFEKESDARLAFSGVRECMLKNRQMLSDSAKKSFDVLSLGTSSDFRSAILEGATLVRVGTAIFGERLAH
jgi:pyridoxal phosphate enzyme (YggS family)